MAAESNVTSSALTADLKIVIAEHLLGECNYLDEVRKCSSAMRQLVNRRRAKDRNADRDQIASEKPSTVAVDSSAEAIEDLRGMLASLSLQASQLSARRQQLQAAVHAAFGDRGAGRSLRQVMREFDAPARTQLGSLLDEMHAKIRDIQSINLGNQAVLAYNLDFYRRLFESLTGEPAAPQSYTARGQMAAASPSSIYREQC